MNPAARTLFLFGLYLVATGALLIVAPALLLQPLGLPVPADVWIRVVGMLLVFIGLYDITAARAGLMSYIRLSVWLRASVTLFLAGFVLVFSAPAALMLFAGVDLAAAAWTAWALRAAVPGTVSLARG